MAATAAEPGPAELPLPGGRPGATVGFHPLVTGRFVGPRARYLREKGRMAWRRALGYGVPRRQWLQVPVPAFLVEHPGVGPILVDTGPSVRGRQAERELRPADALRLQGPPNGPRAGGAGPAPGAGDRAGERGPCRHDPPPRGPRERDLGVPRGHIRREQGREGGGHEQRPVPGLVRRQFDHAFDYRLLDFEGPATESFAGFGRSFDLFGDGSVRCVYTPGHTLGHLSVVVRLHAREVLLTGDAIYLRQNLDEMRLPHRTADDRLYERSLREMRRYVTETPGALIVPSHDWEVWQALDPVYD